MRALSVLRTSTAIGALALAGAGSASAATVSVTGKCFAAWPAQSVANEIPVNVTGLPANASVRVQVVVDSTPVGGTAQLTADSTGSVITSITSWSYGSAGSAAVKSKKARVVVSDFAAGTELGSADIKVTKVGITVDTGRKSAGAKRTWKLSGLKLLGGGNSSSYYAHYFTRGGKKVGKQKLGKIKDACGYMNVKKPLAPFFKTGNFQVRVQASSKYLTEGSWLGGNITLYKSYR